MIGIDEICQHKDSFWIIGIVFIINELLEYWLGKTDKIKSGSKIELLLTALKMSKNKESFMQVGKLKVDLVGGSVQASYNMGSEEVPALAKVEMPAGMLVMPLILQLEAKVQAGEIDPIKGTDLDKEVLLKGLVELKKLLA